MKLNTSKTPFIPKGFTLVSHENNGEIEITKDSFALHLEPEQKDGFMKGEVLAKRMKGKGLNANVLDFLLANKELIPEEWKQKNNRYGMNDVSVFTQAGIDKYFEGMIDVEITNEQFEAIRKAVLENF